MSTSPSAPDGSIAGPAGDGPGRRQITMVFSGLLLTMLMASLDQTILGTALPTIVGELEGVNHMSWVITSYLLATTICMPIFGKLGDLYGRKNLFLISIAIFVIASALCGFSQSMMQLIVFRGIQGIGGAGLMICAQAIVADVVPARDRGRYMGVMGGVFALSSVAGPLIGGFFTDQADWRWCFWINLPVGVFAFVSAAVLLKLPKHEHAQRPPFDYLGTALMAGAVTCLILFTSWGGVEYDWGSGTILGLIAATVVLSVAFVLVELRAAVPIIPLRLFRDSIFTVSTVIGMIVGLGMFGAAAYLPTFLQMVTGETATNSGLLTLPMMAGVLITSILSGRWISVNGRYKIYPIVGTAVSGLGMVLLSLMDAETSRVVAGLYMAVLGAGLGLVMQVLVLAVQNAVPPQEVGTATSANNFFREIGASLGTALFGAIFVSRLGAELERIPGEIAQVVPEPNALTPALVQALPVEMQHFFVTAYADALTPVFLYLSPAFVAAFVLSLMLREKPLATEVMAQMGAPGQAEGTGAAGADRPAAASPDEDGTGEKAVPAGRS
ncbi:MDR family MFS transporter [Allostreptomyces psammosilenae]|uniref:EmrB/QacA subfamily drug resistance transporter n=1 Tax=Allostreptomyces psammosilenae TaxID=1892865 RepID=A0A852ZYP4_9ACTN|nr:MDR family MFS transporter [Allostreptomyces psammosilenae]NYI03208.1 EmrB/QacA subfamily drug resistance transporter [Allostreptomyces psammosilenae]